MERPPISAQQLEPRRVNDDMYLHRPCNKLSLLLTRNISTALYSRKFLLLRVASSNESYVEKHPDELGTSTDPLPLDVLLLVQSFPLGGGVLGSPDDITGKLQQYVPTPAETKRLSDLYHTHVNWYVLCVIS